MLSRLFVSCQELLQIRMVRAFALVYAGTALGYRLILAAAVVSSEAPPLGADKGAGTAAAIILSLGYDILHLYLILLLTTLLLFRRLQQDSGSPGRFFLPIVMPCLLFWQAVAFGTQLNLLFTMNTGFTWSMFMEFFTILSLRDFLQLLRGRDYLALILPVAGFFTVFVRLRPGARPRYLLGIILASILAIIPARILGSKVPDELVLNPSAYLVRDAIRNFTTGRSEISLKTGSNIYLSDNTFATSTHTAGALPGLDASDLNVVVIVLESTATDYVFDTTRYAGGKMPMPFLHALSQKSLYAARHFASNNSSPRSLFSIFSGLYESPETRFFSMQKKLRIPHLLDHLGGKASRDAFLVTPADVDWYFPKAWFRNRGFTRLMDYHALKSISSYEAGPVSVRDEFESVEYFLDLIRKSRKPFLGVYYSFIGHWPYADLPDFRLVSPNTMRDRYINNLYAQDRIIERIIQQLESSGKLGKSIVVIVGDHGEAFYQHPGNRVHSGESYNENLVAPLVIYAPGRVSAQRVEIPSVHADIVPTLLTALNLKYDPNKFQGESLLAGKVRRRYIFSYGNENTLTAVSTDLKKMQILQAKKSCRYFDLVTDWPERNNLECEYASNQYRALNEFYRIQPSLLKSYNEACGATNCR